MQGNNEIYTRCCPPDICDLTEEQITCNAVGLLPSGPLWDAAKQMGVPDNTGRCASLAHYAVFTGKQLFVMIKKILWPSIRESMPWTAVTTLDEWLARLNWQDCFTQCDTNQQYNTLLPFQIETYCGHTTCPIQYSETYLIAIKSALVRSLYRLRLGIINNIDGINNILEPLGTILEGTEQEDTPCSTGYIILKLKALRDYLELPSLDCHAGKITIPAYYDNGCDINRSAGLPRYIWLNIIISFCIVRTLIKSQKIKLQADWCSNQKGK